MAADRGEKPVLLGRGELSFAGPPGDLQTAAPPRVTVIDGGANDRNSCLSPPDPPADMASFPERAMPPTNRLACLLRPWYASIPATALPLSSPLSAAFLLTAGGRHRAGVRTGGGGGVQKVNR